MSVARTARRRRIQIRLGEPQIPPMKRPIKTKHSAEYHARKTAKAKASAGKSFKKA